VTELSRYRLITRWRTEAPVEPAWELIVHSERWPRWWKGVESVVEIAPGRADGIGTVRRYVWRSALGYRLHMQITSTRIERLVLLEGEAAGEVRGWGRWHFRSDPRLTEIVYEWDVEIVNRAMRLLSPVARPLFKWNHHYLMTQGARGLARELGYDVACVALPSIGHP
jgi:hypothetical protein